MKYPLRFTLSQQEYWDLLVIAAEHAREATKSYDKAFYDSRNQSAEKILLDQTLGKLVELSVVLKFFVPNNLPYHADLKVYGKGEKNWDPDFTAAGKPGIEHKSCATDPRWTPSWVIQNEDWKWSSTAPTDILVMCSSFSHDTRELTIHFITPLEVAKRRLGDMRLVIHRAGKKALYQENLPVESFVYLTEHVTL